MLTEDLAALATSGGTALVGAMATDAWQAARDGMARLFGRQGAARQATIESQLDGNVALVERADDPDRARQGLSPLWQMELVRLLEDHPEAEAELQELITRVRDALPSAQQQWVRNIMVNIARDNSRLFAVSDGNIIYHESPSSGSDGQRLSSRSGAADDSSDTR